MDNEARRPLKVREVNIIQAVARYLCEKDITPNKISVTSILFAAFAAAALILYQQQGDWWLPIIAALFIQFRLLCNLFDGMVAVEGGKHTKSGELFNDIPDRIADPLILVSCGYAISHVKYGIELGWLAGIFAVMTAYVRTLSASIGAPVNFQGPMAKQHRMAIITVACLIAAVESGYGTNHYALFYALVIIVAGSAITVVRRAVTAYRYLED